LTNEQVDFVHTLYTHNIPTPVIARVMERMIGGEDTGAFGEPADASGVRHGNTTATMPPEYSPYDA
jgi:hypothetical protein